MYWDKVNADGGIAGRQVELVIEDNGYDVPTQHEKYEAIRDEVAIISQSTGSPHTAAIAQQLVEDDLVAIPLSWYSGWADPEFGQNVFETYTTYCVESMNGIEWLHNNRDVQTVAIISFPGEYGGDGDAGRTHGGRSARARDRVRRRRPGDAAVGRQPEPGLERRRSARSSTSNPDLVWATINPTTLGGDHGRRRRPGLHGPVVGQLADVQLQAARHRPGAAARPVLHRLDVHRHVGRRRAGHGRGRRRDDGRPGPTWPSSDVYILGWTEAMITQAILEQAAANGDMTRAGIVAAANEVTVDFNGLAPTQTWSGEPNDYIVRESYIYDVDLEAFNPIPLGEGDGSTGWVLLEGPYIGDSPPTTTTTGPASSRR